MTLNDSYEHRYGLQVLAEVSLNHTVQLASEISERKISRGRGEGRRSGG